MPIKYGPPVPLRLSADQLEKLALLKSKTGMNRTALLRAAVAYFLPRFLSGEIQIMDCGA